MKSQVMTHQVMTCHSKAMETTPFYNTTRLEGNKLEEKRRSALAQEFWVYAEFNLKKKMTASMVHKRLMKVMDKSGFKGWPITSTRRAMTNLTKKNILVKKENEKAAGMYGDPEHFYELVTDDYSNVN